MGAALLGPRNWRMNSPKNKADEGGLGMNQAALVRGWEFRYVIAGWRGPQGALRVVTVGAERVVSVMGRDSLKTMAAPKLRKLKGSLPVMVA